MPPAEPHKTGTPSGTKVRGCFQCSKRRITCDLGHPICKKCVKKGIECSGLGRFRFSDGVARRGKLKGCRIPALEDTAQTQFVEQSTEQAPLQIRWQHEQRKRQKTSQVEIRPSTSTRSQLFSKTQSASSSSSSSSSSSDSNPKASIVVHTPHTQAYKQRPSISCNAEPSPQASLGNMQVVGPRKRDLPTGNNTLKPWLAPLSPEVRMLFSHFSEAVAPVMVVLDNISNGYRDFILPMACEDEVLRRAVGVVAAQHMGQKRPDLQAVAETGRAAVISRLRRDAQQASPDQVFNVFTWATLIVLLVGETVTGNAEYGYLVQMLLCLSRSSGQNDASPLGKFLVQQTHMFEFLAKPLLGESHGSGTLPNPLDHYLDWLAYELPPGSDIDFIISTTRKAFIQATELYLHKPTSEQELQKSLENLQWLVSQIDPEAPGAHALVWVCFLGAAESKDEKSRMFFTERMSYVYSKTGFRNIPAAIQSLTKIWAQKDSSGSGIGLLKASSVLIM